jgi:hypothetical protein
MRTTSEKRLQKHDTIIHYRSYSDMQEFAANKFIYGNIQ